MHLIKLLISNILDTLHEAKLKVRMAENTSDLSTSEDVQNKTRKRKLIVEDAPIFAGSLNTGNCHFNYYCFLN